MRQTVRRVTSVFVAGAGAYFVLLWFFRIQIIHLLYGGKYVEDSGLPVCLVGLAPIATALTVSFGVALRAFERADYLFWANVAASAIAITLGLWLAASWGVLGATAGYVASYSVFAGASWFFYRKLLLEGSSA